jgi:ABC-type glutathione transport system ATPase component
MTNIEELLDIDMENGVDKGIPVIDTTAVSLRADPFAVREGKTLTWRNVNMTLIGKGKEEERKLLHDVWGEVPEKQITAIMGPSGAGKVRSAALLMVIKIFTVS